MKLRAIFRFEFAYQARRLAPWLYFAGLLGLAWSVIQFNYLDDARNGWMQLNAPLVIASTTVVGCLFWLFAGASVAGDAAARDVESGLHPLSYSAPASRFQYLAGRFLAAYALNALILLALPAGIVLGMLTPGVEPEVFGPWRPLAFVLAYALVALPNAFVATAVQFAFAALSRRAIVSYFGSVVLFAASMGLATFVAVVLRQQDLARLLDPVGMIAIVSGLSDIWTPTEANTRLVGPQPLLVANRLLWIGVGGMVLAFAWRRFRLAHPASGGRRVRRARALVAMQEAEVVRPVAPVVAKASAPFAERRFGAAMQWRQLLAVTLRSLRALARGWTVLAPLAAIGLLVCIVVTVRMEFVEVPLLPRTEHVLTFLTAAVSNPANLVWMIMPLLIIFYAGELMWGDRDARMGELTGAAPVPDWVLFTGRLLALGLLLVGWMLVLGIAGMVGQAVLGYSQFEVDVYTLVLIGLQLPEYLLFALLALTVHTLVNHKHLGALAALAIYGVIAFAPLLGLEHKLWAFGASPGWSYSDIRGFGDSLPPWLAFKGYWGAWAVLLAVLARLAWVRGREPGAAARLRLARARLSRPVAITAAMAGVAASGLGAFIVYNTHVLNDYRPSSAVLADKAAYERLYARHADLPQPRIAATRLHVEIHPQRRAADFRGHYQLVNSTAQPIAEVHIATATAPGLQTRDIAFDRPVARVLEDTALGHQIYRLATPLPPGGSMRLDFDVQLQPRGFGNLGADERVTGNGSWLSTASLLPAIGYQTARELKGVGDRLTQNLPARPLVPLLEDLDARRGVPGDVGTTFEATVGTDADQTAIAPGVLRRSWRQDGRRYFHYASHTPIREQVQFFSGRYDVQRERCSGVDVEVFHHPGHDHVVPGTLRSACASLQLYPALFGPYPHRTMRIVENASRDIGAHSEPSLVDYGDGFALLNPAAEPEGLDLVFAVTAHEVAHQWWGGERLQPALVEGAGLLIESLATFSALQVVDQALGPGQLQAYLGMIRREAQVPRSRASPPLLRAADKYLNYRKGPLAMYALSQYVGRDPVNLALRRLMESHPPGNPVRATSLDLYRELEAVTPARYQPLLNDLLATNTYWEFAAEQAQAKPIADGAWQVTVDLRARKLVVDDAGVESDQPLDEWVEIGVYPGPPPVYDGGMTPVQPIYLQKHRVTRGTQAITVTVPSEPGHVGVDPRVLLMDDRPQDNFVGVEAGARPDTVAGFR